MDKVILFNDPFTNYYKSHLGIASLELLEMAGYEVSVTPPLSSGRLLIFQGLLEQACQTIENTLHLLHARGSDKLMVIGIEPAEILTFRNEYTWMS